MTWRRPPPRFARQGRTAASEKPKKRETSVMFKTLKSPGVLAIVLSAAGILMITMGTRQSLGLFLAPMNSSTGLGVVTLSLALAIGQFVWGLAQPIAGAIADRWGPRYVLLGAILVCAVGLTLTPFMSTGIGLGITQGILFAGGAGAASFSILMGAAAKQVPAEARAAASGVINAGASVGQFVLTPLIQRLIQSLGWMGAMWSTVALLALTIPLVNRLAPAKVNTDPVPVSGSDLLHLGFFTCGFHIAFLVTHLPGEVDLCGLPASVASWSLALIGLANIFGGLYASHLISRFRSKNVLAVMYASRALCVLLYLVAPKTEWTFYLFGISLGATWLATVPPTASIVGKLFGTRFLATLFGMTLVSHQIGGFLGAWLGGLALDHLGSFQWMWY
ncbi:MAG: MFS transporter, partial [Betaproteobacteria bacterium]|nr:MFS transporter [Betaproteobacteria bacterium]